MNSWLAPASGTSLLLRISRFYSPEEAAPFSGSANSIEPAPTAIDDL
ncbi:hypothetical protein ACPOL_5979 [Acidisarcina polymorpha]|uniref:Uncharacterized protein n=1 Tax=Acidisarcina polymorpha TaxID=2211140 RepID=A0A2Z5G7I4_9BACT|nr:hypothetical protein ACPOL_5979 [Acidisarcina polymorpha]